MEVRSHLSFIWTLFTFCFIVSGVYIEENAYKGISISFRSKIRKEQVDFEKLKKVLTKSSEYLYQATRKLFYYDEFIIVVPSEWTGVNDWCEVNVTEVPRSVDIYITDSSEDSSILKAQHSKGCGSSGDIIYMPLAWLKGNDIDELALQFVQQWSIFRYGVFEENADASNSCFASRKNTWSPVGCYSSQIEYKNINFEDGLPVCSVPENFFNRTDLKSSLMFMNVSKVLDYCDGSKDFPHNPVMPTLHNNLCRGRNIWSVITSSEDFRQIKNPSRTDIKLPTETTFKCLSEPKLQVIFAVQNGSSTDLNKGVTAIKYSFIHFLSHLAPTDVKLNLVTFSNETVTEAQTAVDLDATSKDLKDTLNNYVITEKLVNNTCLICGVNKALEVSQKYSHTLPIVLLIAWKSALTGLKVSSFVTSMKEYPTVIMHLVLVEDTESEVLSPDFVEAIRATGGHIHNLPQEPALMSNKIKVILANIMKSPFHLEDKIIVAHEATFMDIKTKELVNDSFVTPKEAIGKLLYVLHCNDSYFEILNGDCTISSPSRKCVKAVELKNNEETIWNYSYIFRSGVYHHICSSVALLSLNPMPEDSYTLRGWLSSNTIIPGDSGLIIYAEIVSLSNRLLKQEYRVGARISGPGILKPIEIELLDNGNGDPDTKKGDGIFSRYFTLFEEKGTYVVSVFSSVSAAEGALFVSGYSSEKAVTPVQTKIIGSFTVLKKPSSVDIIPPNRICDLKVISVDHENNTVELQWTAPGNDYDYGNAAGYDVYITEDWKDLQDSMLTKILPQKLRDTEALKPQDAREKEQRKFTLEKKPEPVLYYIAVRGIDNSGNKAKLSNVIQVFIGKLEDDTNIDTVENNTKNSTDSPTESTLKSHLSTDGFRFYILVAAFCAVILVVILINILIWVFCLKKYKAKCATDRAAKDVPENKEIPPRHKSTENSILNSDYRKQHGYVNRAMIQSASGTDEQYRELEHISIGNPPVLYGKVNKKEKTKNLTKSRSQEHEFEMRKSLHIHQNEEDDLGLV